MAPGTWCQGMAASDKTGTSVHPLAVTARSWCLFGAITKVAGQRWDNDIREVRQLLRLAIKAASAQQWNDAKHRTRSDLLIAIRVAKDLVDARR